MCGIVGITEPQECPPGLFTRMVDRLAHRGPDARGEFRDDFVALGHRRLSVLDLSDRGAQPMTSPEGNVVLVYNGECYNHLELRKLMPEVKWRSSCDTETVLHLYIRFGPTFVEKMRGMFAFAIYDMRERTIHLYRDRLGEKPLYFSDDGTRLLFASEPASLVMHPAFQRDIRLSAVRDLLLYNYIPAPNSIFKQLRKVPPGSRLTYSLATRKARLSRYWSPADFLRSAPDVIPARIEALEEMLGELLLSACRDQSLSDVPLGCFLSGGIDSSAVATMLARATGTPPKTFTIGFENSQWNESAHAARIARHLGTDHHERLYKPEDCLAGIAGLARVTGEPFADPAILPTLLLCRMARETVTVALSGDGGDELFLGYDRYRWADKVAAVSARVPPSLRKAAAHVMRVLPHSKSRMIGNGLLFNNPAHVYPYVFIGWNMPVVRDLLSMPIRREAFDQSPLCRLAEEAYSVRQDTAESGGYTDLVHYLPDDLLVKVDRAAMSTSLETRMPFLDHRIVEFALQLPRRCRMTGGEQKRLLRRVLYRHVPRSLLERPKQGFAVPLRDWFRGPLREMLRERLAAAELRRHGFFSTRVVEKMLARHQSGRWNHERQLFALLAFQLWYREFFP